MKLNHFFIFTALLVLSCLSACKKETDTSESVCEPQSVTLKNYFCFKPTENHYVIQTQAELDSFVNVTACDVCDCMPQVFDIDFTTQTALAIYTSNCGNDNKEVCRNDATQSIVYTLTESPIGCVLPIEGYNLVVVPKFPTNYNVSVVLQ